MSVGIYGMQIFSSARHIKMFPCLFAVDDGEQASIAR